MSIFLIVFLIMVGLMWFASSMDDARDRMEQSLEKAREDSEFEKKLDAQDEKYNNDPCYVPWRCRE